MKRLNSLGYSLYFVVELEMSRDELEIENENRWLILRAKVAEERIKSAFSLFRENDIEPILIKGWAAAREYPEKHRRVFSDIDLAVSPEKYQKGLKLLSGGAGGNLNVDLHRGLRHLDTLEWEKLFENSRIEFIDEVGVRILCPEDHLRVLCVHWLTDGGANKDRLLDIFYLLKNNKEGFNWEKCFAPLDENRRDWIKKTVIIANQNHDLRELKLPFPLEIDSVPEWFMNALEREWASDTKLTPIHAVLDNHEEFWRQFKKRISPNTIQATVFMEGKFDESSRFYYLFGSFFLRLKPFLGKTFSLLKNKIMLKFRNE